MMLEKAKTKGWDAKLVRCALADAFRVLDATTGPVGHRRLKAAMPDYEYSAADIAEQRMMEVEAQRKGETTMRKRLVAKIKPTSLEISRSDLVLFGMGGQKAWLKLCAAYPEHRRVLIAAAKGQAKRYKGREIARWIGMPESTFRAHRDFAADIIAKQLNRAGVAVW
jgi:hypothetical protein